MSETVEGQDDKQGPAASTQQVEPPPIHLRSLAGGALPSELRQEAERIQRLPKSVLGELGPILQACVFQPMTAEVGEQLSRFCVQHEVAEADLGGVLKFCGWLLREASALDLSTDELGEDIRAVFGEAEQLAPILRDNYGPFKRVVRDELLADALVNHGNVLADVDWRVDTIVTERQAPKLGTSIALVTLAYRHAEGTGRLTLQVTPERLARLAQMFAALAQKTHLASGG